MNVCFKSCLCALLLVALPVLKGSAADESADVVARMANGAVIEGTVQEATPDGLVIQGKRGKYTEPWKCLSAGTRYRYEIPMLVAQEVARSNALKKAAADAIKAAAAASNAAAKAAAAKAAKTNAVPVATNTPSKK